MARIASREGWPHLPIPSKRPPVSLAQANARRLRGRAGEVGAGADEGLMDAWIGAGVTLFLAALGGVIWLIRLEGRINLQDALRTALHDRLTGFEQRVYSTLNRIEEKLDDTISRRPSDRNRWDDRE